jgi:hypothetical protein
MNETIAMPSGMIKVRATSLGMLPPITNDFFAEEQATGQALFQRKLFRKPTVKIEPNSAEFVKIAQFLT